MRNLQKCWKDLYSLKHIPAVGDPFGNFDKLVSHVGSHVIDPYHLLGMRTAAKLFLGSYNDTASGEN